MIWQPKNYIITKSTDSSRYSLKKTVSYTSDTLYLFWRWKNFFLRTWVYLLNSLFIFGFLVPFMSSLSFRALFSIKPYYLGYTVNQDTGLLVKDTSDKKRTLVSRIVAIWRHVSFSRKRFEDQPDTGLLGKTVTRFFNCIWNYVFKGFFGTLLLALIFPLLCIFVSTASIFIGLTTPLWYPIISVLLHLLFLFIFDWELDTKFYRRFFPIFTILVKSIVCGIISPILALITAVFLCPTGSVLVTGFALIRKLNRSIVDSCLFHTILKPLARVPATDSFVAKRVSGPGLASNYLYQIRPEQALAAVEITVEIEILKSFIEYMEKRLRAPLETYKQIFSPIFGNYSYELDCSKGPYKALSSEIEKQFEPFNKIYTTRLEKLNKQINDRNLSKVRLSEKNLGIVMNETTRMIEFYYENVILKYRGESSNEMFKKLELEDKDWRLIAGQVLEKIFGAGILVPIEESDDYFNLEINHLNLERYAEMIAKSELKDDLDDLRTRYNPQAKNLVVSIPENNNLQMFGSFPVLYTEHSSSLLSLIVYKAKEKDCK